MRWSKEAKDTIWLMGLQGVNYLAPLLVWPYLMVVLGAEQFGIFSFGIALAQYLMMIVDFGFNLTATKQISIARDNNAEINRLFTATMVAKILLLALTAGIVAIVSVIPRYSAYRTMVWITWWMVVGNTFSMFWLFQGMGKIRWVAIINAVMKLLILPLTFVWVRMPSDVYDAAWIQVAVFLGAGLVTIVLTHSLGLAHYVHVSRKEVTAQLRSSWDIFLSNAATSTYTALYVVILAFFVSESEVGLYSAAEKVMRCACYLIWIPVAQAYFPRVSRLSQENKEEGKRLVRRLTIGLCVALGVIGVVLAFGIEPLMVVLGKDYTGIGRLTAIMAVVPLLVGVGGVQGQMGLIALGEEKQKIVFRNVYLAAGCVALVSVCVLAYLWGAIGAALALVITEATVCISMWRMNKQHD